MSGALNVTGDITAFASDERLKENIQPLENALDKVLALSGFTYTFNEIGESLGFDTTITYVGVSAQQVQAVLPEAVKPAPANEDYLTVQYEKIVPLLIEAIKELKAEIDELKKINN
jgi:trimeric autotransporter adhesin